MKFATPLSIDSVLDELRDALAACNSAVLVAPPGAGKTTRVPLALMEENWLQNRKINDNLKELSPDEAATFQNIGIGYLHAAGQGRPAHGFDGDSSQGPTCMDSLRIGDDSEVTERSWAHIERVRSEAAVRETERRFREELENRLLSEPLSASKARRRSGPSLRPRTCTRVC
jgi:hypothetical protein